MRGWSRTRANSLPKKSSSKLNTSTAPTSPSSTLPASSRRLRAGRTVLCRRRRVPWSRWCGKRCSTRSSSSSALKIAATGATPPRGASSCRSIPNWPGQSSCPPSWTPGFLSLHVLLMLRSSSRRRRRRSTAAFLVILRSSRPCLLEELGVEVVISIAPMMSSNRLSLCSFSLHIYIYIYIYIYGYSRISHFPFKLLFILFRFNILGVKYVCIIIK